MKKRNKKWIIILSLLIINSLIYGQKPTTFLDTLKSSIDTLAKEDLGWQYFQIARQYLEYHPDPDSFEYYINLAGDEAKKFNNQKLSFNYYYYKGVSDYRKSNYQSTIALFDTAEIVSQYANDSIGLAKMLYAKGVMYNHLGKNEAFRESMFKVIDISKKLNKPSLHMSCLLVLSQKAKEMKLYDQQFELLSEAYTLKDKISRRSRLKLLIEMSSYYARQHEINKNDQDFESATGFINRGIALADSMGNKALLIDLWLKLLQLKDNNNQIDRAYLVLSQKILDMGITMEDPFHIFNGYVLKGKALIALNQPQKALALEQPILKYASILDEPSFFHKAYNMLRDAARDAKAYKLALDFSDQFIFYSDSLNSLDNAQAFTDAIQKYEREKKEKEILILQQKQKQVEYEAKKKEAQIKQNLLWLGLAIMGILFVFAWNHYRQKNKLTQLQFESAQNEQKLLRSQMNPHFLFNSLNSIKRFYIDGRIEEANDFMADFGNLLRQILEQSSKPFISIEEELEFLTLYLELEKRRFKKELNYTIHFDSEQFDFEDQIPSLILQPLVENSIWHGIMKSERDGEITISVEKIGADIKCSVMDNGVGYFSTKKSKTHPYTSKGLALIKDRIGKKGEFKIQSILDSNGTVTGTLATLIFKPVM